MAGFEPVTANVRKYFRICKYGPYLAFLTGPLKVGSSWPGQKIGSFAIAFRIFLYTNHFPAENRFSAVPPL